MKSFRQIKYFFYCGLLAIPNLASAVILFDNGLVNVINVPQAVGETVEVRDAPGNVPTTVNLDPGGSIAEGFDVYDTSIINMNAGSVGTSVDGHDNSTVNINDGSVGDGLRAFNNSVFNITGGSLGSEDSFFNDNSMLMMTGGNGEAFIFNDSSQASILGGRLEAVFGGDTSNVLINGAEVWDGFSASETAYIEVQSGLIEPEGLSANDASNIQIFGGTFDLLGETMNSNDRAVIDIYGLAFNRPFGAIADMSGTITGTLLDGSAFNVDFNREVDAAIVLHGPMPIPEPGSLALAVIGIGFVARARRAKEA